MFSAMGLREFYSRCVGAKTNVGPHHLRGQQNRSLASDDAACLLLIYALFREKNIYESHFWFFVLSSFLCCRFI